MPDCNDWILTLTNQVRSIELIVIIIFVCYSSFSRECHEVKKKTILGFQPFEYLKKSRRFKLDGCYIVNGH